MQPQRRRRSRRTVVAVVALLAGVAAMLVWRVTSAGEHLPYRGGAAAPSTVRVTQGLTYSLAVPGGVPAMLRAGVSIRSDNGADVLALQCWYAGGDGAQRPLDVTAESTATKAENTVARFVAPVSGTIRVGCSHWGPMFVPDSDDRPFDWAGLMVLLATVLLTVGAALGLSELRRAAERPRTAARALESVGAAGEQDEVE